MGSYDDIIDLPHHVSATRPHMPITDRAAQFSPFAALTKHGEAIVETARLTWERKELTEDAKADIELRLNLLAKQIARQPQVSITYFQPDEMKDGGSYITVAGIVIKIDVYDHIVVMLDKTKIPIKNIFEINGEMFAGMD
ncbi:hypothetical protein [Acetobacterium woodii]|uniref:YolD-like protein n=1 Tax=Acetobacterium woodii (strain ATCC 29683 / DSM 1030 / JCM 2381 / KCTC 1655 / WB1) TaxID=931626 RepID=H6LHU9_ACEWD|nr:hypothetical protein Awo_c16990 [Acetobacterium woodii DSM 1030]